MRRLLRYLSDSFNLVMALAVLVALAVMIRIGDSQNDKTPPGSPVDLERKLATVIAISDGDSMTVRLAGEEISVRVSGIDCPEFGQAFAREATEFTSKLCLNAEIQIQQTDTDRYGRIVAFVFVGELNLSKELLRNGLAWHFKRYDKSPEFANLERKAQDQRVGLWSAPDPVPPWDWRDQKKNRQQ